MSGVLDGLLSPGDSESAEASSTAPAVEAPDAPREATPAKTDEALNVAAGLDAGPPTADELNTEGVRSLEMGDLDRAIELFHQAVEGEPDVDVYGKNLGEGYLQRALALRATDPASALEDFDAALEWTTDEARREEIRAARERTAAIVETEAEFVVEPTLHFTFKFDGTRPELLDGVERLKILLEDTYQEYGDLFGRRPVEAGEPRIEVVLYRSEGFGRVTGLGDWAGGAFDGTIRVPADDLRDAFRVERIALTLRHEVAHAFTRSIGGKKVPSWLNEGVAQWLEAPERRSFEVRTARERLLASGAEPFTLQRITGSLVGWDDPKEIKRAYDQALAFVDYLATQYGPDIVFGMVAACADGGSSGAATHFRSKLLVELDLILGDFVDGLSDR